MYPPSIGMVMPLIIPDWSSLNRKTIAFTTSSGTENNGSSFLVKIKYLNQNLCTHRRISPVVCDTSRCWPWPRPSPRTPLPWESMLQSGWQRWFESGQSILTLIWSYRKKKYTNLLGAQLGRHNPRDLIQSSLGRSIRSVERQTKQRSHRWNIDNRSWFVFSNQLLCHHLAEVHGRLDIDSKQP